MRFTNNAHFLKETLSDYVVNRDDLPDNIWNGRILLISDDLRFIEQCGRVITQVGGRVTDAYPLNFDTATLAQQIQISAILLHCKSWDTETRTAFEHVDRHCAETNTPLIVRTSLEVLDSVLDHSSCRETQFLLDDDPAELLVSIQTQVQRSRPSFFSNRDELDIIDLQKISADVERIAKVLTQLSGPQDALIGREPVKSPFIEPGVQSHSDDPSPSSPDSAVSDTPFHFKTQDYSELQPLGDAPKSAPAAIGTVTARQVRDLIKARRLRDQYFDSELFADPAWDMLLDLMAARLEGTKVSVSSLCIAASVPPTTALRWIKTMTEEKIFERKADTHDGRRVFIELSNETTAAMVGFFSMIKRSKLMMI